MFGQKRFNKPILELAKVIHGYLSKIIVPLPPSTTEKIVGAKSSASTLTSCFTTIMNIFFFPFYIPTLTKGKLLMDKKSSLLPTISKFPF
ncbi:hypothetical protein AYI68_g5551 [Smittium mucronatum]|uniref:Uncharacterized protein n=1 Tax=Smittium mucronatum TaxID=133383 RepID=A0A1R0GTY0_9FUNG|nr:hypothetical protein AYI68_g5551 [Smittium mucronatum]